MRLTLLPGHQSACLLWDASLAQNGISPSIETKAKRATLSQGNDPLANFLCFGHLDYERSGDTSADISSHWFIGRLDLHLAKPQ